MNPRKENTTTVWESRYLQSYKLFITKIIEWQPDFIIPVARKSCKLFSSLEDIFERVKSCVYYMDYFEFMKVNLKDKKIAIIDDAVRRTSTLKDYRNRLVRKGAFEQNIKTYAFIGHQQLAEKPLLKCDGEAIISNFLSGPAYEEYLIHQSNHLVFKGVHQDIDHLVLEAEVIDITNDDIQEILDFLTQWGYLYSLESPRGMERFGIQGPGFFSINDVISYLNLPVEPDFVEKVRFTFLKEEHKLLCVPMIFPKLRVLNGDLCKLNAPVDPDLPFAFPCQLKHSHLIDKLCYLCLCLLLDCLLARKFLLALRESSPRLNHLFQKIRIRKADLLRSLGEDVGEALTTKIEKFIKKESSHFDEILKQHNTSSDSLFSSLPFSRKSLPAMLQHLRSGYDNAVKEKNGNPVGVKYPKPVEYLLQIDKGMHPLMFTEVLDELCDVGVIVPMTSFVKEEKYWKRLYRTGEPLLDLTPWKRSKYIVPLAIQTLDPEGVERMYLEKAVANFVYDFPSNIAESRENYPELHCLSPQASHWGTQNFIAYPMSEDPFPLSPDKLQDEKLSKWEEFAEFFDYDAQTGKFVSTVPLRGASELFDEKCRVTLRVIRDYFQLLAELKKEFGRVDILNELVLCRDKDWFYKHLMWNVYSWTGFYATFLRELSFGKLDREHLHLSGMEAKSARDKIKFASKFLQDYTKCKAVVDTNIFFEDIWSSHIEKNIIMKDHPLLSIPFISRASKIVKVISTLDGATRLKLEAVKTQEKEKTRRKVYELGPKEFQDLGLDIDIIQFSETKPKTVQEAHQAANEIYDSIFSKIRLLVVPVKNLGEARNQAAVRRITRFERFLQQVNSEKFKENLHRFIEEKSKVYNMVAGSLDEWKPLPDGNILITLKDSLGLKVAFIIDKNGDVVKAKEISN